MQLEDNQQSIIIASLSHIGIDTLLPTMSESEAKSFLIFWLNSKRTKNNNFSIQETASIHKALIDFINAGEIAEINFHRKHMLY